ncbi:hypothetical protein LTR10_004406 [Elasticomyces elasticus]|nr:hypothetical protein LTR10_004406 [Elasticomyces elasticus]KAK4976723.1 hypothetical protein LTR42_002768 [Elasticomyces elasticus]
MSKAAADDAGNSSPVWPRQKAQGSNNNWIKITNRPTGKCSFCNTKMQVYAWKCDSCGKCICSECTEVTGASHDRSKLLAKDHLGNQCGCAYPSGQAPHVQALLNAIPVGPPRTKTDAGGGSNKAGTGSSKRTQAPTDQSEPPEPASGDRDKRRKGTTGAPTPDSSVREQPLSTTKKTGSGSKPSIKEPASEHTVIKQEEVSDSDDDQLMQTPSKPPVRRTPKVTSFRDRAPVEYHHAVSAPLSCPHLMGRATVVVGAGIVGLCVARELAIKTRKTGIQHTITVVELRSAHCELAARGCAGILSVAGVDPRLASLVDNASAAWQEYAQPPAFETATDLKGGNVYHVRRFNGEGKERKPSWFTGRGDENFICDDEEQTSGRIDTTKFGDWLFGQCHKLDVKFIFNHDVRDIVASTTHDVSAVWLQHMESSDHNDGARRKLDCHNLVLTAGPWTTGILKQVLPVSFLTIPNKTQFAIWFAAAPSNNMVSGNGGVDLAKSGAKVTEPEIVATSSGTAVRKSVPPSTTEDDKPDDELGPSDTTASDDVTLVFPDLAAEIDELEDQITMTGRKSHTIIVAGLEAVSMDGPAVPEEALDPGTNNKKPTQHLRRLAGKRLGEENVNKDNARSESTLTSTSTDGLPIIDKIPAYALGRPEVYGADPKTGVWLCFGFGMHGTTLAFGAARALSRRIFGEASGIDDRAVAVPVLRRAVPTRSALQGRK